MSRLTQNSGRPHMASAEAPYNIFDHLEDDYRLSRKPSTISSTTPSDASILNPEFYGYYPLEIARHHGHHSSVPTFDFESPTTPRSHDRLFSPPDHSESAIPQDLDRISLPMARHSRSFSMPNSSQSAGDLGLFNTPVNGRVRSSSGAPRTQRNPEVPKIPQKFRCHNRNNSWANIKPTRPETSPSMPPPAFWMYVAERQTREAVPGSLQSWQVCSDQRRFDPSIKQYPIAAKAPGKAVGKEIASRWSNLNTKISSKPKSANVCDDAPQYPNATGGRGWDVVRDKRKRSCDHTGGNREEKRSHSRKLVKKRLPCDGDL